MCWCVVVCIVCVLVVRCAQGSKYLLPGDIRFLGVWILVLDEDAVVAPGVVKRQCLLECLLMDVRRGHCL